MIVDEILAQEEGKNLEFKENARSLQRIVQTVIAFANTAGGSLVLGVRDKTKEVVGIDKILDEEVRIANVISDLVRPLLIPNIHLLTWRGKDLLVVTVSAQPAPYYHRSKGPVGRRGDFSPRPL